MYWHFSSFLFSIEQNKGQRKSVHGWKGRMKGNPNRQHIFNSSFSCWMFRITFNIWNHQSNEAIIRFAFIANLSFTIPKMDSPHEPFCVGHSKLYHNRLRNLEVFTRTYTHMEHTQHTWCWSITGIFIFFFFVALFFSLLIHLSVFVNVDCQAKISFCKSLLFYCCFVLFFRTLYGICYSLYNFALSLIQNTHWTILHDDTVRGYWKIFVLITFTRTITSCVQSNVRNRMKKKYRRRKRKTNKSQNHHT